MGRPIVIAGEVFIDVVCRGAGRCWIGVGGAGTIVRSLLAQGVQASRLRLLSWSVAGPSGEVVRRLVGGSGVTLTPLSFDPDAGPLRVRVYRRSNEGWQLARHDREGLWSRSRIRRALAAELSALGCSADIVLADFGRLGPLDLDDRFPPLCGLTTKDRSWLSLPTEICCVSTEDLRLRVETSESLRDLAQELAKVARAEEFVLTGSEHGAVYVGLSGTTCVQVEATQGALTAGAGDWLLGALVKARLDGRRTAATIRGAAQEASATCLHDVVGGVAQELATEVPLSQLAHVLGCRS